MGRRLLHRPFLYAAKINWSLPVHNETIPHLRYIIYAYFPHTRGLWTPPCLQSSDSMIYRPECFLFFPSLPYGFHSHVLRVKVSFKPLHYDTPNPLQCIVTMIGHEVATCNGWHLSSWISSERHYAVRKVEVPYASVFWNRYIGGNS